MRAWPQSCEDVGNVGITTCALRGSASSCIKPWHWIGVCKVLPVRPVVIQKFAGLLRVLVRGSSSCAALVSLLGRADSNWKPDKLLLQGNVGGALPPMANTSVLMRCFPFPDDAAPLGSCTSGSRESASCIWVAMRRDRQAWRFGGDLKRAMCSAGRRRVSPDCFLCCDCGPSNKAACCRPIARLSVLV